MESSGLPVFFIEQDWGEDKWDAVVVVFNHYDTLILNGGELTSGAFEHDVGAAVGLGYQGVKTLARTLFDSGRFELVCYHYAKSLEPHPPIEVKQIITRYEEWYVQQA